MNLRKVIARRGNTTVKIGILTYHKNLNYGSVLQAYALHRYLRSLGHEVEVIDYHNAGQDTHNTIFEKTRSLKSLVRNIQALPYYRSLRLHKKKFEAFLEKRITLGQQDYTETSDLSNLNQRYSVFVCGSDQIWNPRSDHYSSAYLLDFVKDKRSCIAYAPSFGTGLLPPAFESTFASAVKDFFALSLREKSGIAYISRLTGREIACVPDPVLLLSRDEWLEIAPKRLIKDPYILCYFIGDVEGMRAFARSMHKKTDLPLVVINKHHRDMFYPNKKYYSSGPEEFLSLVEHCDYVCTNSFHAVMYSLLFQKNFWVFTNAGEGSASSRIVSILETVGLTDRILDSNTPWPEDPTIPIDFGLSQKVLAEFSQEGRSFLQKTTGGLYDSLM